MKSTYYQKWIIIGFLGLVVNSFIIFQILSWSSDISYQLSQIKNVFEQKWSHYDSQKKLLTFVNENASIIDWLHKKKAFDKFSNESIQDYLDSLKKVFPGLNWSCKKNKIQGPFACFEITFNLACLSDNQIWLFMRYLNESGQGIWLIHAFEKTRLGGLTSETLKLIAKKQNVILMKARLNCHWYVKLKK